MALGYAIPASFTLGALTFADSVDATGLGMIGTFHLGPLVHALHRNPRAMGWAFLGNGGSMLGGFIVAQCQGREGKQVLCYAVGPNGKVANAEAADLRHPVE